MYNLIQKNKSLIRKVIPDFMRDSSQYVYDFLKTQKTRKTRDIFCRYPQPQTPVWLAMEDWQFLHQKYPLLSGHIDNYLEGSTSRAKRNANHILSLIPDEYANQIHEFLELGCGDGMVSHFLHNLGKKTTATDISFSLFEKKALSEGVQLLEMDAAALEFADNSFDFVFSFNGFEHFSEPELVLKEAIRVVKDGGYIYLNFAPLYFSPFGLHAWELINVPYCHLLFTKELLQDVSGEKWHSFFATIEQSLNGWSWSDFSALWRRYSDQLNIYKYQEGYDTNYLDLIARYPDVFKSKTQDFNNLICDHIEILLQKKKTVKD